MFPEPEVRTWTCLLKDPIQNPTGEFIHYAWEGEMKEMNKQEETQEGLGLREYMGDPP